MEDKRNPDIYGTWAKDNKTLYDPVLAVKDSEGNVVNNGPIADRGAAFDLATEEGKRGREAALVMEKRMQGEAETGLTAEQLVYIGLVERIKKDYPEALNEITDEKGRKIYVVEGNDFKKPTVDLDEGNDRYQTIVITRDGVFRIRNDSYDGRDLMMRGIDWGRFYDKVEEAVKNNRFVRDSTGNNFRFPMVDIVNQDGLRTIRYASYSTEVIRKLDVAKLEEGAILKHGLEWGDIIGREKKNLVEANGESPIDLDDLWENIKKE